MYLAPIDDQCLSVEPRRVAADQEQGSTCNVIRLTWAAKGDRVDVRRS
jgi:hypothetical protein